MTKKLFFFIALQLAFSSNVFSESDSLWNIWRNSRNHDSVRLEAFKTFIWNEYMFYDPDSALVLSEELYTFADSTHQIKYMGTALNHKAVAFSILGEVNNAIKKYESALDLYLKNNLELPAASVYSNLGTIYNDRGDYPKTAEYYFKALKIFEKFKVKNSMSLVYNNLGVLYNEQGMFDLALEYHKKSLNIKLKSDSNEEIGLSYLNIAAVYGDLKKKELSHEYLDKAYNYFIDSDNKRGLGTYYLNKGHLAHDMQQFQKSLNLYLKAFEVFTAVDDKQNIVLSEMNLGGAYLELEDVDLAAMHLVDAYDHSKRNGMVMSQRAAANMLYDLYKNKGDHENALFFKEEYHFLNDSLTNMEQQEKTLNLKFEHDYEKKAFADSVEFAKKDEVNLLMLSEQKAQIEKDRTQKYALFGGIGLMLVFGAFAYRAFQRKKRDHDTITLQHEELEENHQEIKQSIDYAKRLQDVFLPTNEDLFQYFPQHFLLFKPKDVVSGDFYWFEFDEISQTKIIAVADCTGHGVPGALVSIVCSNALLKAVKELRIIDPAEILNKTRELVIETFTKAGRDVRDGMDITICAIKEDKIKMAGANNGLWLIKNKTRELQEFKANRQPVGWQETLKPFTQTEIDVQEGDIVYLLTDGYPDQFGGERGKKLKKAPLKEFIISIHDQPVDVQKNELDIKFERWRGANEQIDDVCIMGIKF